MITVAAFDPGAARMGWSILLGDGVAPPRYIRSGIHAVERKGMKYQEYRLKVIAEAQWFGAWICDFYHPDIVVSEILPVRGFNNMSQALLALSAITSLQSAAFERAKKVEQISALTVKTTIGGAKNSTKVKVRNGVLQLLPELAPKKSQWTKIFDESDAIAVGLSHLGYDLRTL